MSMIEKDAEDDDDEGRIKFFLIISASPMMVTLFFKYWFEANISKVKGPEQFPIMLMCQRKNKHEKVHEINSTLTRQEKGEDSLGEAQTRDLALQVRLAAPLASDCL